MDFFGSIHFRDGGFSFLGCDVQLGIVFALFAVLILIVIAPRIISWIVIGIAVTFVACLAISICGNIVPGISGKSGIVIFVVIIVILWFGNWYHKKKKS